MESSLLIYYLHMYLIKNYNRLLLNFAKKINYIFPKEPNKPIKIIIVCTYLLM